jgi:hypothetical protein
VTAVQTLQPKKKRQLHIKTPENPSLTGCHATCAGKSLGSHDLFILKMETIQPPETSVTVY